MKLITRKQALQDPLFASFIYGWQNNLSNPEKINDRREAGEYYDESIDDFRFFSQEELDKDFEEEMSFFESVSDTKPTKEYATTATIVVNAPEEVDAISYLSELLNELQEKHDLDYTFLPLFKKPWFVDAEISHHHPETKEIYERFKVFMGEETHVGGIVISKPEELREFLSYLFALVGANYYAYNFFYAEELEIVLSYHYSGEIWFYGFAEESLQKIASFLKENEEIINERYTTYSFRK